MRRMVQAMLLTPAPKAKILAIFGIDMRTCHLITGGAGFIGSCHVLRTRAAGVPVVTVDKLTYAGNLDNLCSLANDTKHCFVQGDIGNDELMAHLMRTHQPTAVINFAAESHVDRSILDPDAFVRTNVLGTCALLRVTLDYWYNLPQDHREAFRFLHVSTDEVYGSLCLGDAPFTENTPYAPNSPYSASKAASDHLVRAFHETHGLPVLITNCSNNYGPRQFPEKLIPLIICHALERQTLPIYGKGDYIRDWLHVKDHCEAIDMVLRRGTVGRTYNVGGRAERTNLDVVHSICAALDRLRPHSDGPYAKLMAFVADRPGHDFRYAIDCTRIERELEWKPRHTFDQGIEDTVSWYLDNQAWAERARGGQYRDWIARQYAGYERVGE
ncbi:MAG: dTDP-glucose 4 [Desulfovibrionaceae bacterium]|nr:MAG: dTDP-glucose 4 [Desulfovibrionaceae bacterium]